MQFPLAFTLPRITGALTVSALAVSGVALSATRASAATTTTPTAAAAQAAPAQAVTAPAKTGTPKPDTYTVQSGDTLSGIAAKKLGAADRYTDLFDWNKGKAQNSGGSLTDPNLIQPGWVLALSGAATASPSSAPTGAGSSAKSTAGTSTASPSQASASESTSTSTSYSNNLDGWIKQAQAVLAAHGYQVSYNAIYQTAIHESAGNPSAVNGWDSNAAKGTPSIGLMQTIQPTFNAYALPGYTDIYNPVDNIIAAARYAAAVYGSLDNVVAARGGGSNWYGY